MNYVYKPTGETIGTGTSNKSGGVFVVVLDHPITSWSFFFLVYIFSF